MCVLAALGKAKDMSFSPFDIQSKEPLFSRDTFVKSRLGILKVVFKMTRGLRQDFKRAILSVCYNFLPYNKVGCKVDVFSFSNFL